jgi:hypothetical protein
MTAMDQAIDHAYVEEHGLVDSYLADRLGEHEREAFEAHYFDCPACVEQLEAASGLREGMLQAAAEDSVRRRVGLLVAIARLSRWRRLALACLLVLLVAVPIGWLAARNRGLERQLAAATGARRGSPRAASVEAQAEAPRQAAAGDRLRLEQELARERQARAEAERDTVRPQVNLAITVLAAVRGGEQAGRMPVNRITLSPGVDSVVLAMELASVDYPSYHATLRGPGGQEVWQAGGLRPDVRDALVVLLPSRLLPPGVYRLVLEGVPAGGRRRAVAEYAFQVVRG